MEIIYKPVPTRSSRESKCAVVSLEITVLVAVQSWLIWTALAAVVLSLALPG